ncbi:hypothetical protein [Amycolatopsis sp. NPDC004378]
MLEELLQLAEPKGVPGDRSHQLRQRIGVASQVIAQGQQVPVGERILGGSTA